MVYSQPDIPITWNECPPRRLGSEWSANQCRLNFATCWKDEFPLVCEGWQDKNSGGGHSPFQFHGLITRRILRERTVWSRPLPSTPINRSRSTQWEKMISILFSFPICIIFKFRWQLVTHNDQSVYHICELDVNESKTKWWHCWFGRSTIGCSIFLSPILSFS